jgi:hypothetical protein
MPEPSNTPQYKLKWLFKLLAIFVLFIAPVLGMAQRTFKFTLINADTGEPMTRKWGTILMNGERYIDCVPTDVEGVCTFKVRNYDSTATYQVEYVNRDDNYLKPGIYDITAVKYSQPVIKIKALKTTLPFACGTVIYYGYYPQEPTSFNDLPIKVQTKVKRYFENRVGKAFYQRLVLNGGQIINLKRFHELDTFYKATPPSYSLCYMVWDSVSKTSVYNFNLKLDEDGNLLAPVPLPDIKHHHLKAKVITLDEATKIAERNNFYDKRTQTNSYYYPVKDCIVWEFKQNEPGEGKRKSVKLLINAHTGSVVDKITSEIYVMY